MSATRTVNLKLEDIFFDELAGSGSALTLKARGWRTTKAGTHETYNLEIKLDRWNVKSFLAQLKEMHVRDRARIAHEQQRIQIEIDALRVSP